MNLTKNGQDLINEEEVKKQRDGYGLEGLTILLDINSSQVDLWILCNIN